MQIKAENVFSVPRWWYILPAYLTLWTLAFSIYSLIDGQGMMEAFGIDTGGASEFILLNSGGRYFALAVAMILGIWVFRTFSSTIVALLARLSMDLLDLWAGLQAGVIADASGVIQSFLMFLLPNFISLWFLVRFKNRALNNT
ncbi:MAG: hypothetical protein F6K19_05480 [Cyanothece sp. SIO1E1]|nr:hypothetical protein [Cyanothece sp. SIO1E1]